MVQGLRSMYYEAGFGSGSFSVLLLLWCSASSLALMI
uniref:Uncharacterized protein n=1 Tax=Arundo donax TaxID=35708 RepID=A0A0A9F4I7_ARUDO